MSALFTLGWPKSPARLFLCIPIREPYAYLKFAKGQSEKPHVWVRCFSKLHYPIRMSAFDRLASFIYLEVCKRLCHRSSQFGLLGKIEDVVPPFALSRYLRYKPKFRSQARMLQRHFRTPLRDFRCRFSCSSLQIKASDNSLMSASSAWAGFLKKKKIKRGTWACRLRVRFLARRPRTHGRLVLLLSWRHSRVEIMSAVPITYLQYHQYDFASTKSSFTAHS